MLLASCKDASTHWCVLTLQQCSLWPPTQHNQAGMSNVMSPFANGLTEELGDM
jgi:hypothetical protein